MKINNNYSSLKCSAQWAKINLGETKFILKEYMNPPDILHRIGDRLKNIKIRLDFNTKN